MTFNLDNMHKHFADCLKDDCNVNMDAYILAYEEIHNFLNLMGSVFGFVASDVDSKKNILKAFRQGEQAESYATIQDMIDHEIDTKAVEKHDYKSGSRNLLRLHRALDYVARFLRGVTDLKDTDGCGHLSKEVYNQTLAKFHPWYIRSGASVAMNLLPTKEGLVHKMCRNNSAEHEHMLKLLPKVVKEMEEVYERTQRLYEKHNLLDLP
jgi:hypothetical protein